MASAAPSASVVSWRIARSTARTRASAYGRPLSKLMVPATTAAVVTGGGLSTTIGGTWSTTMGGTWSTTRRHADDGIDDRLRAIVEDARDRQLMLLLEPPDRALGRGPEAVPARR